MIENSRQDLFAALTGPWAAYTQRFTRLAPGEQEAILRQQGYSRLTDLLAHVTAWWREALAAVPHILEDPNWVPPEYDVDGFNAAAVGRARLQTAEQTLQEFESTRLALVELVQGLPPEAFENEHLEKRLRTEIIGHLEEHELPGHPI